jgi:hypothetical protein
MSAAAEATSQSRPGRLTTIDVVVIAKDKLGVPIKAIDSESASIYDYTLRITRSEDGRHFQVGLAPEKGCGTAWFASDSGIVYVGRAVAGCVKQ